MTKPPELARAELIEALCQRYHKLPHEVEAADVSVLRHVQILMLGHPQEQE